MTEKTRQKLVEYVSINGRCRTSPLAQQTCRSQSKNPERNLGRNLTQFDVERMNSFIGSGELGKLSGAKKSGDFRREPGEMSGITGDWVCEAKGAGPRAAHRDPTREPGAVAGSGPAAVTHSQEAHFNEPYRSARRPAVWRLVTTSAGSSSDSPSSTAATAHAIGGLCNGQPASHTWLDASGQYGPALIDGTNHDDTIVGSDGDDTIDGQRRRRRHLRRGRRRLHRRRDRRRRHPGRHRRRQPRRRPRPGHRRRRRRQRHRLRRRRATTSSSAAAATTS